MKEEDQNELFKIPELLQEYRRIYKIVSQHTDEDISKEDIYTYIYVKLLLSSSIENIIVPISPIVPYPPILSSISITPELATFLGKTTTYYNHVSLIYRDIYDYILHNNLYDTHHKSRVLVTDENLNRLLRLDASILMKYYFLHYHIPHYLKIHIKKP